MPATITQAIQLVASCANVKKVTVPQPLQPTLYVNHMLNLCTLLPICTPLFKVQLLTNIFSECLVEYSGEITVAVKSRERMKKTVRETGSLSVEDWGS